MNDALTFAQCLSKIMEKHRLTAANLSTLISARSELRNVLADDGTHAKRVKLFEKLKKSQLFDAEDYQDLSHSLEISRLGIERYRFQRAIGEILSGRSLKTAKEIMTDREVSLSERFAKLDNAEKVEILCFNCCNHSVFSALIPLFENPKRDISLKHYIQCDSSINIAAEYVSVVMPLLFDERYISYYRPSSLESKIPSLGGNQIFVKAIVDNKIVEMVFIMVGNRTMYELPNASNCSIFSFISRVLADAEPRPVPIKETTPYKLDFTSLCMTFLSHELNRATYYIGCDLCFQQIPTDIALAALRDKGFVSDEETNQIISRTLSIHEQRYQNQYKKKKPTYRIMSRAGCERFLATGETTDHFIGFRPFTPAERKSIFLNMLQAAKENSNFIPLLLIDQDFNHQYNLVCYEKLGISIDAKDTDYDISSGYRSVFLVLPEFTKQYLSYYLDILVGERCYSRQESLSLLEKMYQDFLLENQLEP